MNLLTFQNRNEFFELVCDVFEKKIKTNINSIIGKILEFNSASCTKSYFGVVTLCLFFKIMKKN